MMTVWPKLRLFTVSVPFEAEEEENDKNDTLGLLWALRTSKSPSFEIWQKYVRLEC
jgi:hypothetical protein